MIIKANFETPYYTLLHEAGYRLIKEITLYPEAGDPRTDLTLTVVTDNELLHFDPVQISELPDTPSAISAVAQHLSFHLVSKLSEKCSTLLTIQVNAGTTILAVLRQEVWIHPLDSFPGMRYPKYLAKYSTPHHAYIAEIKQKTVLYLQQNGLPTAFDGYQSGDKQRISDIAATLFYTLKRENWVYSALLPSYEKEGQRIRMIDLVRQQRFGNCIDLSLVMCACLEAMDLHPLLILIPGHAFVGCWLTNSRMDAPVTAYKSDIVNRIGKGNESILLWEATAVCVGRQENFGEAVALAESLLIGDKAFQYAIDIRAARLSGITPLSQIRETSTFSSLPLNSTEKTEETFLKLPEPSPAESLLTATTPASKQQRWERKLLDLTLRNSLLNLRLSNNTIQLVNIPFESLLDALTTGKTFTLINTSALDIYLDRRQLIDTLHETDGLYTYAANEMEQHRLVSVYNTADMQSVLTHIFRNNMLAIDETGANSLYLTLGTLKWYDIKTPDTGRVAPLIMVPVDIKRQSAQSRFLLKFREEDIQLNTTLVAFLMQEFGLDLSGLERHFEDTENIDINLIFNTIRQAILPHKRWEVDHLLFLSNFHFSTQVLWQDIRHNMQSFAMHPIVKRLVNRDYEEENSLLLPVHTDTTHFPTSEHIFPISADSSQVEAIITANIGKSFVLHGPPGTGKSQTITNIIANFLFHEKTVLFVASKKAALDVVHKRLEDIGLNNFTLELHSNKSRKQAVMEHLENTLLQSKILQDDTFKKTAQQAAATRDEIEHIQKAIHKKEAAGLSVYELAEALAAYPAPTEIHYLLPPETLLSLHSTRIAQWKQWIHSIAHNPLFQSDYKQHPLSELLSIHDHGTMEPFIASIDPSWIPNLKETLYNIQKIFKNQEFTSISNITNLLELAQKIEHNSSIPIRLMDSSFDEHYDDYIQTINLINTRQSIYNEINKSANEAALTIESTTLLKDYERAISQWFIPRFFNKAKIKRQLRPYLIHPLDDTGILKLLKALQQYQNLENTLKKEHNVLIIKNINKILSEHNPLEILHNYRDIVLSLTDTAHITDTLSYIRDRAATLPANTGITALFPVELWEQLHSLRLQWQRLEPIIKQLNTTFIWTTPVLSLDDLATTLSLLQQNIRQLHAWGQFRKLMLQSENNGLKKYIEYIQNQNIKNTLLEQHFSQTLYIELLQYYTRNNPLLRHFSGLQAAKLAEAYRLLHHNFTEYTKKELYTRLLQRLPDPQYAQVDHSELTTLQRAIKSKGRGISIRQLLQRTSGLLPKLSPCMLMSPISVAQYLDISLPKFDLVIFDEASQLPTAEAISAMARGKQTIIVGDPRQMPPTSFFTSQGEDEDPDDLEDLESILDDTLSIQVPSKYLLRHYRSNHESLITFSNKAFYNNTLFTFPSADDQVSRVRLIHIAGFYDKGKTRQNPAEARAVVDAVLQRLRAPGLQHPTMGIVTFSQPQQRLIEDLLDEAFAHHPELERMAQQLDDPIFIKNLENVQGDERDIILFSVGYGPDKDGKVSMNFGPLNREGGWRRLNVAITRARREMLVFSTLLPEMIDTTKSASQGVASLKGFLSFAAGRSVHNTTASQSPGGIIQAIGAFLQSNGYHITYNIGSSHFKIDIGVTHTHHPDRFILGIILDSKNYYQAGNVNDRIIILPAVLQQLGWTVMHLSALDWHNHTADIKEGIIHQLALLSTPAIPGPVTTEQPHDLYTFCPESLQEASIDQEFQNTSTKRKTYEAITFSKMQQTGADALLSTTNREIVKNQLLRLISAEAPVNLSVIQKKIATAWGVSRTGNRIEKYIQQLLHESGAVVTNFTEEYFVWRPGYTPDRLEQYRVMPEQEKRQVTDVCPEEILLCLQEVLQHHIRLEKEHAFRYLQKTLLNSRYNTACNIYLEEAITVANAVSKIIYIAPDHYKHI